EIAQNGLEALELFENSPKDTYDLILMDVQMPEMDGYEAARHIRKLDGDIPIIAMTARTLVDEKQRCFEAGMNDHISKPIDVDEFFATIANWVGGYHEGTKEISAGQGLYAAGIDIKEGLRRAGGNMGLYMDLLYKFAQGLEGQMEGIHQAILIGDFQRAEEINHSLKGSAGNIGAIGILNAAVLLEEWLRSPGAESAPSLLHEMEDILKKTAASILESPQIKKYMGGTSYSEAIRDERQVKHFLRLLSDSDMRALEYFKRFSDELKNRMGEESYQILEGLMSEFRFLEAAEILEQEFMGG
ncbi:MAG: response regulator, partial [Clostridia bacterium]|nr:response regulator [Clostridia bacterium]